MKTFNAISNRLWRTKDGLAYLEFALILPILLALLLGGIEISRYIQTSQKVDKLTHTIVDLVAQAPQISEGELDQIMIAAQHVMQPHNFTDDGVIIVSCVGYNEFDQLVVKWQHQGGGNLSRSSAIGAEGTAATVPADFTVEDRDNVIIAETFFSFSPIVNEEFVQDIEFYRTAFYLPRLGELDTLNP